MSYDFYLTEPGTGDTIILDQPHQIKGGTFALGGTNEAELNITWNYAKHYCRVICPKLGVKKIIGMTGKDSIVLLEQAAEKLGDNVDETDYWNPTEGNAKQALLGLITLAKMRPDGVWRCDF